MEKKKEDFIKYLEEANGIIASATGRAHITRQTYYNWVKKDAEFKKACEDIIETQVDFVEDRLLNNINSGDTTAIIFYLKTKGKARGYNERAIAAESAKASLSVSAKGKKATAELIANKEEVLRNRLQDACLYKAEMEEQIHLTALLLVKLDNLTEQALAPSYNAVNTEVSREGNLRVTTNPLEAEWRQCAALAQSAIKALGMNNDSKIRTEERKMEDDDGISALIKKINAI